MQDLIGRTLLDRYRIVRFIGRGGMAVVYEAWDEKRAAAVAVKLMHEDLAEDAVFLRRFAAEAKTLASIDHPHIVRFLGFEEGRGLAFMVMEFVNGVPLRRQLSLLGRPLTLPETLGVLQPVCGALHYAHQLGIYHCDIKPANIFIDQGGKVILGDFGIASLSDSATVTFSTPGTPAYMSPEQCLGGQRLDGRTDIYSLGITAYEMLSLDRPFKGDTTVSQGSRAERVRWEQVNATPPPLHDTNPAIAPQVDGVILRALEKEPTQRYQEVVEFCSALHEASATQPVPITPLVDPYEETVVEQFASTPYASSASAAAVRPPASTGRVTPAAATAIDAPSVAEPAPAPKKKSRALPIFAALIVIALLAAAGFYFFGGGRDLLASGTMPASPGGSAAVAVVPEASPTSEPELTDTPAPEPTEEPPTAVVVVPTEIPPTETPLPPTLTPEPSNNFVLYALNASNDMLDNDEMDIVLQGLSAHFSAIDPALNSGLLVYGEESTILEDGGCGKANVDQRVSIRPDNAEPIWSAVTELNPIGVAPVAQALVEAHSHFTFGGQHSNALIVITDGESHCEDNEDILRRVRVLQVDSGQALPIHVVGIRVSDEEAVLYETLVSEIAEGSFQNVTDATGLLNALDQIIGGLPVE